MVLSRLYGSHKKNKCTVCAVQCILPAKRADIFGITGWWKFENQIFGNLYCEDTKSHTFNSYAFMI